MNKDIVDLVESLGGTVLFDGALIQFTDTTFMAALKKIYESGALEEREACVKAIEDQIGWDIDDPESTAIKAIRARGASMTEEDEAFAELEKALGWRKRQLVMKQLDPISNKIRNDALEEVAKEVDNFKAFEKDTMASFAAYIRSMKGAQT